ncbi:uncharacterized protein LOC9652145 [Selaginella moellendorffii]|nr:uncharacterized protein LOC9652145 [Selaginella moellendorffii]|eukprot:XP_002993055.2 uncharacterized protein LOC9652145 [Selaginella moellendorffii]
MLLSQAFPSNPLYQELFLPRTKHKRSSMIIQAGGWTGKSSGEPGKNRKSWKRATEKYMRPFSIDVYISSRYVNAKIVHRVTSKTVAVATTNAKDLRASLPSLTSASACEVIGKLIAERAMEADVYAVTYVPRKNERLQEKLEIVLNTVKENGVAVL